MSYKKSKKGVVLPYVLIIGTFLMLLASGLFILSGSNLKLFRDGYQDRQAMLNAKSAVEYARAYLFTSEKQPKNFYVTSTLDEYNVATDFAVAEMNTPTPEALGKPDEHGAVKLASCVLTEDTSAPATFKVDVQGRCISKNMNTDKDRYEFLNYKSKFKLATQATQEPDKIKPDPIMITEPKADVVKSIPATEARINELDAAIGKADNSITDAEIAIENNMNQAIKEINNAVSGEFKWVTRPVYTNDIPIDATKDGWIKEANQKAAKNPEYLVKIERGGKVSNGGAGTLTAKKIVFVEPLMVDANFTITSENVNFNKSFTVSDKVSCTITADYFSTGESGGAITCGDSSTLSIKSQNPAATTYFAQDATFGQDAKLLVTTNWFRTAGKLLGNRSSLNINSSSPDNILKGAWFDQQVNGFKNLNVALPNGHVSFSKPVVLGKKDVPETWNISARTAQLGSDPNADAVTFPTYAGSSLTFGSEQKSTGTYVTINGGLNIQSHGSFNSYADKLIVAGKTIANSANIMAHPANPVSPNAVNFKSVYQDGGMLDIKSTSTFIVETLTVKKCMVDIIQHTANSRLTIDGNVNLSNFCNVNINVITTVINGEASLDAGAKLTFNSESPPYVKVPLTKVTFDKDVSIASQSKVIFNTTILQFNSSLTVQDSSTAFTVVPSSDSEINYVRAYGIITVNQKATIDIKSTYTAIHGNVAIMNSAKIGIKSHTPGDFKSAVLFVGLDDRNQEVTTKIVQNNSILNISGDFVRFNGTYLSDGDTSAESQLDIKPVNDITSADVFPRENNVYMNKFDLKAPTSNVNIKADYSDFTGNPYVQTDYTNESRPTVDKYKPTSENKIEFTKKVSFNVEPRLLAPTAAEPELNSTVYLGNINSIGTSESETTKINIKADSIVQKGTFNAVDTELTLSQTGDYNSVFVCEGKFDYTNGKINLFTAADEHARAVKFAGLTTLKNVTDFNINSQNILMENTLTLNGDKKTNLGWHVTTKPTADPSQPPPYLGLLELSTVVLEKEQTLDASVLDYLVLRGDLDYKFIIKYRPDTLSPPVSGHTLSIYCRPLLQDKSFIKTKGSPIRKVGYYQISSTESGDNILDDRTWYAKKTTGFPKVSPIPYEYTLPRDDAGNPIYPEPDDIDGGTVDIVFPAVPQDNPAFVHINGADITQASVDAAGNKSLWIDGSIGAQRNTLNIGTTTTNEKTKKITFNTDTVVIDGTFKGTRLKIQAKHVYFINGANSPLSDSTITAEYIYFGSPPGDVPTSLGRITLGIHNDEDLDSQVYGVVFDTELKPNGISIGAAAKAPNTYVDFRKDVSANFSNGKLSIDGLHYACFKGKTSLTSKAKLNCTNTTNIEFRNDFDSDFDMIMDGANIVSFKNLFIRGNTNMSINSSNVVFNESVVRTDVGATGTYLGVHIDGLNDISRTALHFTKDISRCFNNPATTPHSYKKGGLIYTKGFGYNWLLDESSTDPTINPPKLPDFPTTGKAVIEQEVFLK